MISEFHKKECSHTNKMESLVHPIIFSYSARIVVVNRSNLSSRFDAVIDRVEIRVIIFVLIELIHELLTFICIC